MMPRRNHVYPRWLRAAIEHVPGLQALRRRWFFHYSESLTLAIRHPRTIGWLTSRRSAAFMRGQLPDPDLRARAWPDYTFGCKRVLFSSHYLPTLALTNVELVTEPIAELTETGLRTADGELHEVDGIVWATGFKASDFVAPMRATRIEVRADVEAASDREPQARFGGTAWTACHSWYQDENGRIVANWPGYMGEYVERTRTLDPAEYVSRRDALQAVKERGRAGGWSRRRG